MFYGFWNLNWILEFQVFHPDISKISFKILELTEFSNYP